MTHYFDVTLTNFKGSNMMACDRSGTSDPYLVINFDGTQKFKSKVIKKTLNPVWKKFSCKITYETRMFERMTSKYLTINVFDRDRFGSDDPMGMMKVDLWTIATGPVKVDYLLREKGKGAGRLSFEVKMDNICEINTILDQVKVANVVGKNNNGTSNVFLEYFYVEEYSMPGEVNKSTTINGTNNPVWNSPFKSLMIKSSLKELLNGAIRISMKHQVRGSQPEVLGDLDLNFREVLTNNLQKEMQIPINMKFFNSGNEAGTLDCVLKISNLPIFSQLLGGKLTENGVNGGSLLLPGIFAPKE
ncbi:tricalbin-1-related [Anaeramoeba flamelloides]|uniref:Tricalbin-1-related n=1 Tax=Anaeramoeba flamelloides TaxID=1746091 RepID=A0AAV8A4Z9_9EUKA|nr:tricalbin-1-related [Anaeramoeba flamelloides]